MTVGIYLRTTPHNLLGFANNQMIFQNDRDDQRFAEYIKGKVVIVGRNVWNNCVDYSWGKYIRPLDHGKDTVNPYCDVVRLTKQSLSSTNNSGVDRFNTLDEIKEFYPDKDIVIIGGAALFEQFFHEADEILISAVDLSISGEVPFSKMKVLNDDQWILRETEVFTPEVVNTLQFITPEIKKRDNPLPCKLLKDYTEISRMARLIFSRYVKCSELELTYLQLLNDLHRYLDGTFYYLKQFPERLKGLNARLEKEMDDYIQTRIEDDLFMHREPSITKEKLISGNGLSKEERIRANQYRPAKIPTGHQFFVGWTDLIKSIPKEKWPGYQVILPKTYQTGIDRLYKNVERRDLYRIKEIPKERLDDIVQDQQPMTFNFTPNDFGEGTANRGITGYLDVTQGDITLRLFL